MFEELQYRLLRTLAPLRHDPPAASADSSRVGTVKILTLLGEGFLGRVKGRAVVDFGCGVGHEVVALAQAGAARVIGLDIRDSVLDLARCRAAGSGVADRCEFATSFAGQVDFVLSFDAFEHFRDPLAALRAMQALLKPGGSIIFSFGPLWYHPRGGHLFAVFPWAHLIFSEAALIRWRSDFKDDGATRFGEVEGGLNQMTIRRFEEMVRCSGMETIALELVPIRRLKFLHGRVTREFTTAVVRGELVRVEE